MIYNDCDSRIQRRFGIYLRFRSSHLAVTSSASSVRLFESIPVVFVYVLPLAFIEFKHKVKDYRLLKLPSWRTLYVVHQMRCRTFKNILLSIEHYSRIA